MFTKHFLNALPFFGYLAAPKTWITTEIQIGRFGEFVILEADYLRVGF